MKQSILGKWHCRLLMASFGLAMLFSSSVFAQSGTWGNLTWNLSTDSVLTISGTGSMQSGSFPWNTSTYREKIKSVIIEEGVTSVAYNAFYSSSLKLESVTLPSSLDSIGDRAFYQQKLLQEISIPENVSYVGNQAFAYCDNLKIVYWNTSKITLNAWSSSSTPFYSSKNINTFVFSDKIKTIPDYLCYGLSSLAQVSLPATLDSIGYQAFYQTALREITIPENVSYVGNQAFASCDSLTTVHWNTSKMRMNNIWSSSNAPFNNSKNITTVTFDNNVKVIPNYLFRNCTNLTQVSLPAALDTIGGSAFYGTKIKEIKLPDGVQYIGGTAFYQTLLQTITLPEGLQYIGGSAFAQTPLQAINIPESVEYIGYRTFHQTSIREITIPKNVSEIGDNAFGDCDSLKTVHWNTNKITTWDKYSSEIPFDGCDNLTTIIFDDSIHVIPKYICSGLASLLNVTLPAALDSIHDDAFYGTGIKEITIPENVVYMDNSAFTYDSIKTVHWKASKYPQKFPFRGCTTLTFGENITSIPKNFCSNAKKVAHVTLPTAVDSIGDNAFAGTQLTEIICSDSLRYIGQGAFNNSLLTAITFPEALTYIGDGAFYNTQLTEITIPENVTYIGKGAFNASALKTVYWNAKDLQMTLSDKWKPLSTSVTAITFGDSVKMIPAYVCQGMSSLKQVTLPSSLEKIGSYAFSRTGIQSIEFPQTLTHIYKQAFEYAPIKEVTLPDGLLYLGDYVFWGYHLKRLNLPASLQSVGKMYNTSSSSTSNFVSSTIDYLEIAAHDSCLSTVPLFQLVDTIKTLVIAEHIDSIDITRWFSNVNNIYVENLQYNPVTLKYVMTPVSYAQFMNGELLAVDVDGDGIIETPLNTSSSVYHPLGFKKCTLNKQANAQKSLIPFTYNNDDKVDYYYHQSGDSYYNRKDTVYIYTNEQDSISLRCKIASSLNYDKVGVLDINADGLTDIFLTDEIAIQQADGSYLMHAIDYLLPEEVDSAIYQQKVYSGPYRTQGLGSGFSSISATPQSPYYETDGSYFAMDIDRNGYMDILDLATGNVRLNFGNNQFRLLNIGGRILDIKDLNGDAVPDILFYNKDTKTTYFMYYKDNGFVVKTLVEDLPVAKAWCYDFDRDGDADILLAFNYDYTIKYSFLVFYRNDGNDKYVKKENAFPETLEFRDCKDIDNDGYYEIIAGHGISTSFYSGYDWYNIIRCSSKLQATISTDTISYPNTTSVGSLAIGDFDNDGLVEYNLTANKSYLTSTFAGIPNTAPLQMEAPTIIYDGYSQHLQISWKDGIDAETQSVDLTCALRIGSAPGKGDILYAHAKADGQRLNLKEGNMGNEHQYMFNVRGLKQGKYYIAVQAVDGNAKGGAWSEECVYEHTLLSSAFSINKPEITTMDTLVIALHAPKNENYTYDWNFGDSVVVVKEESNRIYLYYNTAGKRTITLQVTDEAGNQSELSEQAVNIFPCKLVEESYSNSPSFLVDFNQDGILDGVNKDGFLENDGTGNFTSIGKLFNLNLDFYTCVLGGSGTGTGNDHRCIDYNMDGLPDILGYTNKGNVFINLEDKDFEPLAINTTYFGRPFTSLSGGSAVYVNTEFFHDFNNDGQPDMLLNNSITPNVGKMQFGKSIALPTERDIQGVYDFNRDGYLDILSSVRVKEENKWINHPLIILNKGNWMFETIILDNIVNSGKVADIDNDGYVDFITIPTTMTYQIYYGDSNNTYQRTETIYMPADFEGSIDAYNDYIFDIDNNGYLDIITGCSGCSDYIYIIYNFEDYFDLNLSQDITHYNSSSDSWADVNGDQTPDLLSGPILNHDGLIIRGINNLNQTRITNTPPATPTNLRMYQTPEGVVLEWNDSQDKETPRVQMRYNVGVKKSGATGEDAYIISPLNGGSDVAAIVPSHLYLRSTRMVIPNTALEIGKDYEFTVQAIDGWNATSATSAPFTFTMQESNGIVLSAYETCMGEPITAFYSGGDIGVWEVDGGEVVTLDNGSLEITYMEGGLHTIAITVDEKRYEASVYVKSDSTDITFSLPPTVLGGAPVYFTLPEAFADPSNDVKITGDAKIQRRNGTLEAVAYFPKENGTYAISVHYKGRGACQNEVVYTQTTQVLGNNVTPVISIVGIDETTQKNVIRWETPANILEQTDLFDQIWVQKEANRTNDFVTIAKLPLTASEFVDMSSDPTVRKSRYRLKLTTTYGGESQASAVHSNVHVTLNKGLQNSVNIIWTPYEGGVIDQYTILRGTSPDNLQVLTTASGYETSYTDKTVVEGEDYYYALSYSNTYETEWITLNKGQRNKPAMVRSNVATGSSNIVASNESYETIFPTALSIHTLETDSKITNQQTKLHLYPAFIPNNATIGRVAWSITAGANLAQIDNNGELSYIGNGQSGSVIVEGRTIDGSNLSNTITIPVEWKIDTVYVESIELSPSVVNLSPSQTAVQMQARPWPENATVQNVAWSLTGDYDGIVTISEDGLITAYKNSNDKNIQVVATAQDGSGVTATAPVTVTDFLGILTESITITGCETTTTLGYACTLTAQHTPQEAIPQITWSVVEGIDLLSIDQNGNVQTLGCTGTAIVRASANDGSGVYADHSIVVDFGEIIVMDRWNQVIDSVLYLTSNDFTMSEINGYKNAYSLGGWNWEQWEVVEGNDIIKIVDTQFHIFTTTGKNGKAVVRLTHRTCPSMYKDIVIMIDGVEPRIVLSLSNPSFDETHETIRVSAVSSTGGIGGVPLSNFDWKVTNGEDIATILSTGWRSCELKATGKKGNVTVCVTAEAQGVTYTADTTIIADFPASVSVTGIMLDYTEVTLEIGNSIQLTATVSPSDADDQSIEWKSDNTNVATVTNGLVEAINSGIATITATTQDGGYTASCQVQVVSGNYGEECENISYSETFSTSLGEFTSINASGADAWVNNSQSSFVQINSYDSGANDDWLISPAFDLTNKKSAIVSFTHVTAYGNKDNHYTHCMVKVSADYVLTGDVNTATWHTIPNVAYSAYNWAWVDQTFILPEVILGSPYVVIAFHYNVTSKDDLPAWKIKNFTLEAECQTTTTDVILPNEEDRPAVRKIIENGIMYIVYPTGDKYTIDGRKVD